jgi:hypothetical protein
MLAAFALAVVSTAANAQIYHEFQGRFYEVVPSNRITWAAANAQANLRIHPPTGFVGHLATINTEDEDLFIKSLNVPPPGNRTELWVGGIQLDCPGEPGCGFIWLNNDPITPPPPPSTFIPYTNWHVGEPNNDAKKGGDEDRLVVSLRNGIYGWNDQDDPGLVWGYVVEYGDQNIPFLANECAFEGPGCPAVKTNPLGSTPENPTKPVITVKFPESAEFIDEDEDPYQVQTWVINDSPARCASNSTKRELELDLIPEIPAQDGQPAQFVGPEAIVPDYLCTHPNNPKFLVIKTSSPVQIPSGIVDITNNTTAFLNPAYDCNAPILPPETTLGQDVVVFQYDDKELMLESQFAPNPHPGSLIESTKGCINPSRGSGGKGSFIFLGLYIHQGNALSPHARLVDLLKYKLDLLVFAVNEAQGENAIQTGDANKLRNQALNARGDLDNGNFGELAAHMSNFLKFVGEAIIATEQPNNNVTRNWHGEFLMRAENIVFMTNVKIAPFAP